VREDEKEIGIYEDLTRKQNWAVEEEMQRQKCEKKQEKVSFRLTLHRTPQTLEVLTVILLFLGL
jgi:hypothetical protein